MALQVKETPSPNIAQFGRLDHPDVAAAGEKGIDIIEASRVPNKDRNTLLPVPAIGLEEIFLAHCLAARVLDASIARLAHPQVPESTVNPRQILSQRPAAGFLVRGHAVAVSQKSDGACGIVEPDTITIERTSGSHKSQVRPPVPLRASNEKIR